jgi:hypothetical protein
MTWSGEGNGKPRFGRSVMGATAWKAPAQAELRPTGAGASRFAYLAALRASRVQEPQTRKTQEKKMTSETQRVSVPNAASKTLSRKYSPPNQSGKIANATRRAARIQPAIFFPEFIFDRVGSESNSAGRLRF